MAYKEPNHKCIICGESYYACDYCEQEVQYTPWRRVCDDFTCYQIYMNLKSYDGGLIDKATCAKEMKKIGVTLNNLSKYNDDVQKKLKDILAETTSEKTEDTVVEKVTYKNNKSTSK